MTTRPDSPTEVGTIDTDRKRNNTMKKLIMTTMCACLAMTTLANDTEL